jgi:hypothetical protein
MISKLQGLIRRRILINYQVLPELVQPLLPPGFRPKLHHDSAIAGICLLRLEHVRRGGLPALLGTSSENAEHRFAVTWEKGGKPHEGIYISRRDTNARLNRLAGGEPFPGRQHAATFKVQDDGRKVDVDMVSKQDGREIVVQVRGTTAAKLPETSGFGSVAEASAFFEAGGLSYSATKAGDRLAGMRLQAATWEVAPLKTEHVYSSFFNDQGRFPKDTILFDCALIMRDIEHEWHREADLRPATGA